ncbi:MAG TPA: hydrolase [Casimicrobiaceae bacterium]|jgi:nicotinamidase-related amidase|nr:hydrolase [Casimicrobiaceae bacterium]
MLLDSKRSLLLVIDVQEKLLPAIHDHAAIAAGIAWLARVARRLDVPVAATEQYPRGLGALVPAIRELLPEGAVGSKNHFSCVAAGCLPGLPGADRAQVVLVGIEAHVCVLQTALELAEEGREVYVVADAVGSRRPYDRDVALARMRDEGVRIVTREMVVFEWLQEAGTPLFKDISKEFLRGQ